MPNWCSTTYAFTGAEKDLRDLKEKIELYTSRPRWDGSEVKQYQFDKDWLGNIVVGFGFDPDDDAFYCRGTLVGVSISDALYVSTETAWSPLPEMWEHIIEKYYPGVNFVFCAGEPACDVFVNTDKEHRFLKEKYLLDDGDDIWWYVEADEVEEACDWLRNDYHCKGDTLEELVDFYNHEHPDNEIWIHEFTADY